jgi:hypothetical protein
MFFILVFLHLSEQNVYVGIDSPEYNSRAGFSSELDLCLGGAKFRSSFGCKLTIDFPSFV